LAAPAAFKTVANLLSRRVITYYEAQMQDFQAQVAWQVQIESTRQTLIGDYFFKEQ